MIDMEVALDVVVSSVRSVGGLFPAAEHPIRTQNKLEQLRILTDGLVEAVRVRIIDKLPNLNPPFELNKEHLRSIDTASTVGDITAIVINNSTEISVDKNDVNAFRARRYS